MKRLNILAIFDNGGATLDRYTFVLNERDRGFYQMLGTDETGAGYSQFGGGSYERRGKNDHLGKPVKWQDLSEELQKHVERRLA